MSSFLPRKFFLLFTKMCCPPPIKVWSYMNTCAAVSAGTCATLLCNQKKNQAVCSKFHQHKENPTRILPQCKCKAKNLVTEHQFDSAISLHLLQNLACASNLKCTAIFHFGQGKNIVPTIWLHWKKRISKFINRVCAIKKNVRMHSIFPTSRDACACWQSNSSASWCAIPHRNSTN